MASDVTIEDRPYPTLTRTERTAAERRKRGRNALILSGCVFVALLIFVAIRQQYYISERDHAQHVAAVESSGKTSAQAAASGAAKVAGQGQQLAKNVTSQCKTDKAFRAENLALCTQASVLATVTPTPVPGPSGPIGPEGRGIKAAQNVGGHLVLVYTDGTAQDVGNFVGPAGKDGKNGRGITEQTIVGTHLVASYTDGSVVDLGQVVGAAGSQGPQGPNGISVTNVTETADFHLIVAYSDGHSQDIGQLPVGPQGPKGDPGSPGASGASGESGASGQPGYPPGAIVIQVPGIAPGETSTETCTPSGEAGPGSQPTYTCQ